MIWHRRSTLFLLAGLLLGMAVARLLCFQGFVSPVRIASGSMVPTMLGAHFQVLCEDCRFSFQCDATSPPDTGEAVCPNCGFPGNRLVPSQLRHGQRVAIDRFPYGLSSPRRWDLVAFVDPLDPAKHAVKRVVGMPGEAVEIRQGDLWVAGDLLRKPIDVQHAMAVLVHDDAFRPTRTRSLPPRWQAASQVTGWHQRPVGYEFIPSAEPAVTERELTDLHVTEPHVTEPDEVDWLTYQNWRCFASPLARSEPTPILDHYGYNQNTSRELHAVDDVWLACRLRWAADGKARLHVHTRRDGFELELDRGRQLATLRHDGTIVHAHACSLPSICDLEFGICDRQVFLSVNHRPTFREPFEAAGQLRAPDASPVAIGGAASPLRIESLRVYRDVYYLEPNQFGQDWTMRADHNRGEILVLGDNVPISLDSRRWPTPGLPHKSLIGRVLMPF